VPREDLGVAVDPDPYAERRLPLERPALEAPRDDLGAVTERDDPPRDGAEARGAEKDRDADGAEARGAEKDRDADGAEARGAEKDRPPPPPPPRGLMDPRLWEWARGAGRQRRKEPRTSRTRAMLAFMATPGGKERRACAATDHRKPDAGSFMANS
jgi:hypothetical protein